MTTNHTSIDQRCINALRFLSIDAVQQARSGHPGLPMGAAPMAYVLWKRFLNVNPQDTNWLNRDRFILSAGHGSMLLYALQYLAGFEGMPLDAIKNFRQYQSVATGHPENTLVPGIEVTTGPLGQGISNAVGMAIAEAHLAARFNKPEFKVVDHHIYTIAGDGCMMEGVSSEACSLAGHLGLGKLITLYDENRITIDGATDLTFTEDIGKRFDAYGWHVQIVEDGNHDLEGIAAAIEQAKSVTDKPSLIRIRTTIAYGSPNKAGSSGSHGAPLGDEEIQKTRENLDWPYAPFEIPDDVLAQMREIGADGARAQQKWSELFTGYQEHYPAEAKELERLVRGELPQGWTAGLPTYTPADKGDATRNLSGQCLNGAAATVPELIGGSADLAGSNKTHLKESSYLQRGEMGGRIVPFGVREHGMGAICNGIALYGAGLIPYCATFLVFTDYMRGAIRNAALSDAGVIYVMTHDSIAVGEDGPTHQPVEHLAALRAIPNLNVIRPADGKETAGAYQVAIESRNRPTLIALSRQSVPHLEHTGADQVGRGAYVYSDSDGPAALILIGTGTELSLCVEAAAVLEKKGLAVRVVSMPSCSLFERQDEAYRESVLPRGVTKRLAVEAGCDMGWHRYVGSEGATVTINRFGTSAPGAQCLELFGFSVENVVLQATKLLG